MNLSIALCIAYAGIIFGASSVPGNSLPDFHIPDYLLHALEYMALGALIAWCLLGAKRLYASRVLWQATFLGSVYGLTDEFHQHFVPGRVADPRDWVVDTLGVLAGATMIVLIWSIKSWWERSKN